jgi:hypothetical protein
MKGKVLDVMISQTVVQALVDVPVVTQKDELVWLRHQLGLLQRKHLQLPDVVATSDPATLIQIAAATIALVDTVKATVDWVPVMSHPIIREEKYKYKKK